MAYQSSYELLTNYGYALLEQLEGDDRQHQYNPNDEGDPEAYNNIFYSGVYGGEINPDSAQEFIVYSIQLPENAAELEDDEIWATLGEELDNHFGGWVIDRESNRVYLSAEPTYA